MDAATSTGALGAVLAQKVKGKSGEKVVPPALDLDNKVHQMIFDHEWNYQPAKIYLKIPIAPLTPTVAKTSPPKIISHEKFLGFTEDMVIDSFFLSTASLLAVYNCKPPQSTLEQRKMATKELKKGVLALKLRDFCFNNNYGKYKEFLTEFEQGKQSMDPNLLLAESLAQALYRPIIILSTLYRHQIQPVKQFNHNSVRPPLIYGLHQVGEHPTFSTKKWNLGWMI